MTECYQPHHPATACQARIRGVDYHFLRWGRAGGKPLLLLHGWMDCAATFQFLVDALPAPLLEYDIVAPDWRGFGRSGWAAEGYWFPDYLADLDAIVAWHPGAQPVALVGHSMGGMVAGLYAGIRPARVSHLVSLEGFGLPATDPTTAPSRYERWLDEVAAAPFERTLPGLDVVAGRLRANNTRLPHSWAAWLADSLARTTEVGACYRADPRHKWVNPVLYRLEEAKACWRQITAPVLWLAGDEAKLLKWLQESPEQFAMRKEAIARLDYATLAGCGHNLHHDAPAEVASRIAGFLAANA